MNSDLIAIAGKKGSGKDTIAGVFVDEGYEIVRFADGIKTMLRALLAYASVSEETIERMIEGDLKEVNTAYLGGRSPRYALQTLGTEWGRNLMADNLWTTLTTYKLIDTDKAVVTDMRFPNEASMIQRLDGIMLRVTRPSAENSGDTHSSEQFIDALPVHTDIENAGTIEDLQTEASLQVQRLSR